MIRDRRMQQLIAKDKEPITPFIDKVRQLYTDYGVSTILVMGGSGDYFDVADTVIAMENFQPEDVTEKAQAIAQSNIRWNVPRKAANSLVALRRVCRYQTVSTLVGGSAM
jgi:predicted ABC-class ATPase